MSTSSAQSNQIPAGLMQALRRPNATTRPSQLLTDFSGGITDVSERDLPDTTTDADADASVIVNKYDLLCPRPECGSIILKSRVASLHQKPSIQLDPMDIPTHSLFTPLSEPPAEMDWWLVSPSPMKFENIGFSRPVSNPTGVKRKLLICAECDLGPLGWSEEGGTEFWLVCSRVRYRG